MNETLKQQIIGAVRTLLTTAGAVYAAKGLINEAVVEQLVGAIVVIASAAWDVWDKKRYANREALAVNVGIAVADRTVGATAPVSVEKAPAVIEAFAPVASGVPPANKIDTGLAITPQSPVLPPAK